MRVQRLFHKKDVKLFCYKSPNKLGEICARLEVHLTKKGTESAVTALLQLKRSLLWIHEEFAVQVTPVFGATDIILLAVVRRSVSLCTAAERPSLYRPFAISLERLLYPGSACLATWN